MKKKFLFFISVFTFLTVFAVSVSAAPSDYFSGTESDFDIGDSVFVVPQGYRLPRSFEYFLDSSPSYNLNLVDDLVFDLSDCDFSAYSELKLKFIKGDDIYSFLIIVNSSRFYVFSQDYMSLWEYDLSSSDKLVAFNVLSLIESASEKFSSFPFSADNLPILFSITETSNPDAFYVYCSLSFIESSGDSSSCTQTHITDTDGDGYDDSSYNAGATVGYNNGYDSGHDAGYDIGYEAGQLSLGADEDGDGYLDEPYNAGYDAGTKNTESYNVGFEDGKDWQYNYDLSTGAVSNFVTDVGGSIISAFLYTGSNIQILGISLLSILGIIVVGIFAFWVFRKVKGN